MEVPTPTTPHLFWLVRWHPWWNTETNFTRKWHTRPHTDAQIQNEDLGTIGYLLLHQYCSLIKLPWKGSPAVVETLTLFFHLGYFSISSFGTCSMLINKALLWEFHRGTQVAFREDEQPLRIKVNQGVWSSVIRKWSSLCYLQIENPGYGSFVSQILTALFEKLHGIALWWRTESKELFLRCLCWFMKFVKRCDHYFQLPSLSSKFFS